MGCSLVGVGIRIAWLGGVIAMVVGSNPRQMKNTSIGNYQNGYSHSSYLTYVTAGAQEVFPDLHLYEGEFWHVRTTW